MNASKGFKISGVFLFIMVFSMVFFQCICLADSAAPSSSAQSGQATVSEVKVRGNAAISKSKVLSVVQMRAGQIFDEIAASNDAGRIAAIAGVEQAYYNTETVDGRVILTYVVVERKKIVSIAFKGNNKIKSGKLSSKLGVKRGDFLDSVIVRKGIEAIEELYRKKGFFFAKIKLREELFAVGKVVCDIEEGPRVKVKSVKFDGNIEIKSKDLKKVAKTKKRKFLFWSRYYDDQAVSDDVEKLIAAYQKKGFLDAKVKSKVDFAEKRSWLSIFSRKGTPGRKLASIRFVIDEGPEYIVESIVIKGNAFFDGDYLLKGLKLKSGFFYSDGQADYDAGKILSKYLEKGFIDAKVQQRRIFTGKGKVNAEFEIVEGDRFRIGQIAITGNETTDDKVIRRILDEDDFMPGGWYNADIARGDGRGDLEKEIKSQAMTESVFITATGTAASQRNAHVGIVEGRTGSIMLGVGVSSDSGVSAPFSFEQRNFDISDWPSSPKELFNGNSFKGAGQRLRISAEPGTEQTTFSISFTEPYLYDKPVALNVVASGFQRDRESYEEERLKGYVGFSKRYKNKWQRGVSFRAESVDVKSVDLDAPKEIKDVEGINDLFGARLFIGKNTTDNRYRPSKGINFDAGYEQVVGDHTFGVLSGTQRWYKTLNEDLVNRKTILETKFHAATIIGDAPPFEKFYAGGIGSIRGFDYRGISPRGFATDGSGRRDDPIGSDWLVTGSAEIDVPLGSEVFSWLLFTDVGIIETGGPRASIGTGIQILIPQWFGPVPMRFELAYPFMKDDDDDRRAFSFSIGALF